ncbi:glycoside hydrolase family 1 protein [Actinoplanes sp. TBRC 11911]|uniref:family 1 glycosylhydrolase n=1 Tax=Actinoplanes sp. TBRC 11911 TaxID=2729386 RepID=UPI00145E3DE0|nr:family 1 glycosylhydrolase [Actinoplanes sp. TBRC 11911]NMO51827.1 glycoside hydrolase family 1 protein [Actinoplanes sp. TBRC 11911]
MAFPAGFLWGVATSGHQTEGFNTASDTWFAEHVSPTVFREPSGAACNAYEMWAGDVDRVAAMGLNAFRFSVEWARVEPSPGTFDEEALAHYGAIVDRCRAAGLAPIVTFNHMTSPHWFAARGGWLDDEAPSRFAAYCRAVTDSFGAGIAFAVTLNEPNLPQLLSWSGVPSSVGDLERATLTAAAREAGVPRYRLANVMLPEDFGAIADGMAAGHSAARAAIKAARPELPVGFRLAVADDQAVGDDGVRDQKRSQVYARWLHLASADDFLGVQNYERFRYDANGLLPPPSGAPLNDMGSDVYPLSLANAVRYAHAASGVPILVTEHGLAHDDDRLRAAFIPAALDGLSDAVRDGVPVLGYLHWTLMDNFEWTSGYGMRLGLHEVDRATFTRTPKPSAAVYAAIARGNASAP